LSIDKFNEKVSFIWSVADLLRGPYKPAQYGQVMLPMTALRRLDCVLEPTKEKVLKRLERLRGSPVKDLEPILNRVAGQSFHNTSKFDFRTLKGDPNNIAANLTHYIKSFSSRAREVIEYFGFEEQIIKLDKANRLYLIVSKFGEIDLHPNTVPNIEMGYIFEELIRRFCEQRNEEAGDHFTPREVIRLMVNLLFVSDEDILTKKGIIKTLFDPACGTGGMLSVADEYLHELNPDGRLELFGQEYNDESYAICGSDMMIKGQSLENIKFGDSFTQDGFAGSTYDYMLANPPFGLEWRAEEDFIHKEHEERGFDGRFGAGLPRINDGSLLFLQHMISKMKPEGSRIGIVFNGSTLFTGDAGSGESNIRKWIIENDRLEAIIALPDQLFYNTGIFTYIWIVANKKAPERKGKIQLIKAVDFCQKMRRSLGQKRKEINEEQIKEITNTYGEFTENEHSKIFDNEDFGYHKITVERPLKLSFQILPERIEALKEVPAFQNVARSRKKGEAGQAETESGKKLQEAIIQALNSMDTMKVYKNRDTFETDLLTACNKQGIKLPTPTRKAIINALSERDETADICTDAKGKPEPDPELRDYENVPLKQDIHEYFRREVIPHVPDAWIDESKTKPGYEINFNRYFYKYTPPRPLEEIELDIRAIEQDIIRMINEVTG
jgi:type I restriction enzyme M protein